MPFVTGKKRDMMSIQVTDPVAELFPGFKGIPEPKEEFANRFAIDPGRIDVAVVPCVACDRSGRRLGYGGGYYDVFLSQKAPQAQRVGICVEDQLVSAVPVAAHDAEMDVVITEEQVYR